MFSLRKLTYHVGFLYLGCFVITLGILLHPKGLIEILGYTSEGLEYLIESVFLFFFSLWARYVVYNLERDLTIRYQELPQSFEALSFLTIAGQAVTVLLCFTSSVNIQRVANYAAC